MAAEGEEPIDAGPTGYVPNLVEEMRKFEMGGVYFGPEETYNLQKSLTVTFLFNLC